MTQQQDMTFTDPIWEWQEAAGEPAGDYAAFLVYANLRPIDRTYRKAWREWTKGTTREGGQVSSSFSRTADEYRWAERAAARDIAELKSRYVNWAERDWEWREQDYEIGARLRKKANRALDNIDDEALELSPGEAANLARIASELQAKSIPQIFNLSAMQVQEALAALPEAKRLQVIELMTQKRLPQNSETIEGEYTVVDEAR